jgi:hypothetical protein
MVLLKSVKAQTVGTQAQHVPEVIYLHCFTQTTGQKIVLESDAHPDLSPATPPQRIFTQKITLGSDFEVPIFGNKPPMVTGRITRDMDELNAEIRIDGVSAGEYSCKVELDKIFDKKAAWLGGCLYRYRYVISKNPVIDPFLKKQAAIDAKRLQEATERTRKNRELYRKNAMVEPEGSGHPATTPEDKIPAEIQPETQPLKDAPR